MSKGQIIENHMTIQGIIIDGARRSGTHLLYRLLDNHPSLFNSLVEVYFLEYLHLLSPKAREQFIEFYFSADINEVFDALAERALLPLYRGDLSYEPGVVSTDRMFLQLDETLMKTRITETRPMAPKCVEGIWFNWYANLQQVMYPLVDPRPVVLKSPDYGKSALGATEFLSNYKIIFIVRDPIFAINSLRKLRINQPHRYKLTLTRMLSEVSSYQEMYLTIQFLEANCADNVCVIRYEDLLQNAEASLQRIARFLDIPFLSELIQPTFNGQSWRGDSSFGETVGISKQPLDADRLLLSGEEIRMISDCLADFMTTYGYGNK